MKTEWKICFYSVITAFIILAITLSWPYISDEIWGKPPDTCINAFGIEYSCTIDELREESPIRAKWSVVPIKVPEGVSNVNCQTPILIFFNYPYSENETLYIITAQNKGEGIDRNIKIDISFFPNAIKSVEIRRENRVSLIQGGVTGTYAVFEIDELLPNEVQDIKILIKGKGIKSFTAWSENQRNIKNIFIYDVIVEPDRNFVN